MMLWLIVATGTMKNILFGNLFQAPCLREMEKRAGIVAATKERQGA